MTPPALPGLWICGQSLAVLVECDPTDGATSPRWTWDSRTAAGLPDERRAWFGDLDDVKPVVCDGVACVLITSSTSGGCVLLRRADQAVLFSLQVVNAHSAELLPDGTVAIAGSIGSDALVLKHRSAGPRAAGAFASHALHHGHGAVFEPARNLLWTCGGPVVRVYRWREGACAPDRDIALPTGEAHDLMPDPCSGDLMVTTQHRVWRIDPRTDAIDPFAPLHEMADVKSVSIEATTGLLAYTRWDEHVELRASDGSLRILDFPGHRVYKARWDRSCQLVAKPTAGG